MIENLFFTTFLSVIVDIKQEISTSEQYFEPFSNFFHLLIFRLFQAPCLLHSIGVRGVGLKASLSAVFQPS